MIYKLFNNSKIYLKGLTLKLQLKKLIAYLQTFVQDILYYYYCYNYISIIYNIFFFFFFLKKEK